LPAPLIPLTIISLFIFLIFFFLLGKEKEAKKKIIFLFLLFSKKEINTLVFSETGISVFSPN